MLITNLTHLLKPILNDSSFTICNSKVYVLHIKLS